MRADLHETALVDDDDQIGTRDKGEPVGDDHDRAAARHCREVLLDDGFAFGIKRARGLVQYQHRRVMDQRAGDRQTLALDHTAARARSVVMSLERAMSVGIGALGALFVLSDQMTVGALVAFNMMGLRMVQPLIHASGLMQDYQRAALSLKLLAQLMQTAPEPASGQLAPAFRG